MAMRRLAAPGTRGLLNCLKCGKSIGRTIGKRTGIKCRNCGTVHIISRTSQGNIMLTDKKYADRFRWAKAQEGTT